MKKLLTILSSLGIVATSAASVAACGTSRTVLVEDSMATCRVKLTSILKELVVQTDVILDKYTSDDEMITQILKDQKIAKELLTRDYVSIDRLYQTNKLLIDDVREWVDTALVIDKGYWEEIVENLAKKADKGYVDGKFSDLTDRIKQVENKTSDLSAGDITRIKAELDNLKSIIIGDKGLTSKFNELDHKVHVLIEEDIAALRKNIDELKAELENLRVGDINRIDKELKELGAMINANDTWMRAQVDVLKNENSKLWNELAKKADREYVEAEVKKLQVQIDQLMANDNTKASQIRDIQIQINDLVILLGEIDSRLSRDISDLKGKFNELTNQTIDKINQKINDLQTQVKSLKITDIAGLQNELDTLKNTLKNNDGKINELTTKVNNANKRLDALETLVNQKADQAFVESELKKIEDKTNELSANLDNLKTKDLADLKTRLDTIVNIVGESEEEGLLGTVKELGNQISELNQKLLDKADKTTVETSFTEVNRKIDQLSSQQEINVNDIASLKNELDLLASFVGQIGDQGLSQKLLGLTNQVQELTDKTIINLTNRINKLETNLGDLTIQDVTNLKRSLETLTNTIEQNNTALLTEIKNLTEQVGNLTILANQKADKDYVDEQLDKLSIKIKESNDRINDLKTNDLKKLQEQLEDLANFAGKTGNQGLNQKLLGLTNQVQELTDKTIINLTYQINKLETNLGDLTAQEVYTLKDSLNQLTNLVAGKGGLQDRLTALEEKIKRGINWRSEEVSRNSNNTNWNFLKLENFLADTSTTWFFSFFATSKNRGEVLHRIYNGTTLITKDMFGDKNEIKFNIGFTAWSNGGLINNYVRSWFKKSGDDLFVSMSLYDNNDPSWTYSTLKIVWSAVN